MENMSLMRFVVFKTIKDKSLSSIIEREIKREIKEQKEYVEERKNGFYRGNLIAERENLIPSVENRLMKCDFVDFSKSKYYDKEYRKRYTQEILDRLHIKI